jgi:hypothetical protein
MASALGARSNFVIFHPSNLIAVVLYVALTLIADGTWPPVKWILHGKTSTFSMWTPAQIEHKG